MQKNQHLRKHGNKQVPAKKGAFDRVHYMTRLSNNVTKRKFRTGKERSFQSICVKNWEHKMRMKSTNLNQSLRLILSEQCLVSEKAVK